MTESTGQAPKGAIDPAIARRDAAALSADPAGPPHPLVHLAAVLWRHGSDGDSRSGAAGAADGGSNRFARTATPVFFLISGYLDFPGFDGSLAAWRIKTRRRMQPHRGSVGIRRGGCDPRVYAPLRRLSLLVHSRSHGARAGSAVPSLAGDAHRIVVPFALLVCWALRLPFLPIPSSEATTYFTLGTWIATSRRQLFVPVGWLRWTVPLYTAAAGACRDPCRHVLRVAAYRTALHRGHQRRALTLRRRGGDLATPLPASRRAPSRCRSPAPSARGRARTRSRSRSCASDNRRGYAAAR